MNFKHIKCITHITKGTRVIRKSLKVSQPEAEGRLANSAAPPPFSAATNAFCVTDLNCSCVASCSIDRPAEIRQEEISMALHAADKGNN